LGEAIGEMLPFAVGVAISPLPIVAVVLMLVTERARSNGPAFLAGWWIGVGVVGAIVLLVSSGAGAQDEGEPATWVSVLKLLLGPLLLLLAVAQWRKRPHEGEEPVTPQWMGALDSFTPAKALGAGALLSGLNPKNLLLVVAGAAAIAGAGISTGEQTVVLLIFVLIASIGVATPVAIYFLMGDKAGDLLDGLKNWMSRNNAVIMAVLFVVLGAKLVGDAIAGLS
jgi:threonine/homoserine/homoserine lactone efflux protein